MCASLNAVLNGDGTILLFDIYIDGAWHGSRRTLRQCEAYLMQFQE